MYNAYCVYLTTAAAHSEHRMAEGLVSAPPSDPSVRMRRTHTKAASFLSVTAATTLWQHPSSYSPTSSWLLLSCGPKYFSCNWSIEMLAEIFNSYLCVEYLCLCVLQIKNACKKKELVIFSWKQPTLFSFLKIQWIFFPSYSTNRDTFTRLPIPSLQHFLFTVGGWPLYYQAKWQQRKLAESSGVHLTCPCMRSCPTSLCEAHFLCAFTVVHQTEQQNNRHIFCSLFS